MGLTGKLQDFAPADLLKVVGYCRKAGRLELRSRDRCAEVRFISGQVIHAASSLLPERLGEALLERGLVDRATLDQVLRRQQDNGESRSLGELLIAEHGLSREAVEELVRRHIEAAVASFFTWEEGSFLIEHGEPQVGTALEARPFLLEDGLDPGRLIRECTRRAAAAAPPPDPLSLPDLLPPSRPHSPPPVPVACAPVPPPAPTFSPLPLPVAAPPALSAAPVIPALAVAERLLPEPAPAAAPLSPPTLDATLMALHQPQTADELFALVLRFAGRHLRRAVLFQVGDSEVSGLDQFGVLPAGASAELRIRGIRLPAGADSLLRGVLENPAPLRVAPVPQRRWDDYLYRQLGGETPAEAYLLPLLSRGRVVALLYGDNLPERTPVTGTAPLELVAALAELAMEGRRLEEQAAAGR